MSKIGFIKVKVCQNQAENKNLEKSVLVNKIRFIAREKMLVEGDVNEVYFKKKSIINK